MFKHECSLWSFKGLQLTASRGNTGGVACSLKGSQYVIRMYVISMWVPIECMYIIMEDIVSRW